MKSQENELKFIDAEAFLPEQQGLSFKEIVLNHFKKIGQLASVEFKGGYYNEKTQVINNTILTTKEYIPDTREEYSNAVDYLSDLLFPHYDDEIKNFEKEHYKKLNSLDKKNNNYREKKLQLKRQLFRELSNFLKRVRYFETKYLEE